MHGSVNAKGAQAPVSVEAFHDRLATLSPDLPRRMRQCADYLAAHSDRVAVSTVADLAAGAGVPPSAFMRFCQVLGFAGYSDMQRLFRTAYAPGLPDYATRLRNLKSQGADSPAMMLAEFVEAGRASLELLAKTTDYQRLGQAVALLAQAETVHVMGLRRAFPVASYLAYVFDKMAVPAMLHDGVGALGQRFALRPKDALLVISFAPYSEETLALAQQAKACGLRIVALTDAGNTPLARSADAVLTVAEVDFGAFRSLSATIALAITLAVAVGSARK